MLLFCFLTEMRCFGSVNSYKRPRALEAEACHLSAATCTLWCDLYHTVCWVYSICKVVTCFSCMHEPVSTSTVNLFMVSRKADGGLRRTEDLYESSFYPPLLLPLSFSPCVSVSVLSP